MSGDVFTAGVTLCTAVSLLLVVDVRVLLFAYLFCSSYDACTPGGPWNVQVPVGGAANAVRANRQNRGDEDG
jgi:hypothetical protein